MYDQLTRVLPLVEVVKLASEMLDSLPTRNPDLPSQLAQAKLVAIRNMVSGKLFKQDDGKISCKLITVTYFLNTLIEYKNHSGQIISGESLFMIYQKSRVQAKTKYASDNNKCIRLRKFFEEIKYYMYCFCVCNIFYSLKINLAIFNLDNPKYKFKQ